MLWVKMGSIVAVAAVAATLAVHKTGKLAQLSERAGIQEQALIQKDQAIAQERALRQQEEAERLKAESEHQKALAALSERDRAHRESVEKANTLMTEIRRLRNEQAELEAWAIRYHPDGLDSVYQSATSDTARTHSGNQDSNPESTGQSD